MRIKCLEIANFRKLESVRIDLSPGTTLLVGANNSGKTSAMEAVKQFLGDDPFTLSDFTLSHLPEIRDMGKRWEQASTSPLLAANPRVEIASGMQTIDEWSSLLPQVDIWIEAREYELYRAPDLLPILGSYAGGVGIRLRLEPRDIKLLVSDYLEAREAVERTQFAANQITARPRLRPGNLVDFLEGRVGHYFTIRVYRLDPQRISGPVEFFSENVGRPRATADKTGAAKPQALDSETLQVSRSLVRSLITVDIIPAQRALQNNGDAATLSSSIASYYREHLDFSQHPTPDDLNAILATQQATKLFDNRLQEVFKPTLEEVAKMGYPGSGNPQPIIKTDMRLTDGLKRESVLRYQVGTPEDESDSTLFELPEGLNGLGYQNLVLMIFKIMSFRDRRLRIGKLAITNQETPERTPVHLVLIEEPEAHLHAQVQQVFIKQAYSTLTTFLKDPIYDGLTAQLLVSTHSSHIAHETDFADIRYFCRGTLQSGHPIPTTVVKNLGSVFGGSDETSRFVKRYLKINHCNLFFADAAILLEGAAERILLPSLISRSHPAISQCFVEYLEIGGAHAHRLEKLIVELGIPTLVVTDIDAEGMDGKKAPPERDCGQLSGSDSLRVWLQSSNQLDELMDLEDSKKVYRGPTNVGVRFAYQTEATIILPGVDSAVLVIPSTFEDALVADNIPLFATMDGVGLVKKFTAAVHAAQQDSGQSFARNLYDALKTGSKAQFALDMLLALEDEAELRLPNYIREGLDWLEIEVQALPLMPSADLDELSSSTAAMDTTA